RRQTSHVAVVIRRRQRPLFEVVQAMRSSSGFASHLDCRKKQRDQQTDDRNDDKEFYQCESATTDHVLSPYAAERRRLMAATRPIARRPPPRPYGQNVLGRDRWSGGVSSSSGNPKAERRKSSWRTLPGSTSESDQVHTSVT